METLGDALPKEQARVRKILDYYKEIGSAGTFGTLMIEHYLQVADKAAMSGDLAAMLLAYDNLKSIEA